MTVCSKLDRLFHLRSFRDKTFNIEGGGVFYFSFPVVNESHFNGILADFWRQDFDSNVF